MRAGADSIRILTVDDHRVFREELAMIFATQPDMNLVAQASNGREAIQQFRQHRPDITLMDLQMPDINGLDAMIAIHREFPEAKIIILTTYASDLQNAMTLGAKLTCLKLNWIRNCCRRSASFKPGNKGFS